MLGNPIFVHDQLMVRGTTEYLKGMVGVRVDGYRLNRFGKAGQRANRNTLANAARGRTAREHWRSVGLTTRQLRQFRRFFYSLGKSF